MNSLFWQRHAPLTSRLGHYAKFTLGRRLVTLNFAKNEETHEEA
jgi:hypothetical protein